MNSPFFPWKGWQERNASLEIQLCIDPWQMFWKYSLLCCRSWHVTFTGPTTRDTWHVMLRRGPSFTVAVPSLVPSWIVVTSLLILNVQIFCYFRRHFPIARESRTACAKCSSPQKQNRHCWVLLPHLDQASSWSCLSSAQPGAAAVYCNYCM